jgi:hypothetical protein
MFFSYTQATEKALRLLRNPHYFQWYLIPLLALLIYVYAVEVERRKWNIILAGLAFWGLEWFFEIINALILHFNKHTAVWTTPGGTAYLPLIGLTIEISMMFAIAGVIFAKVLPEDPKMNILGIPNRWALIVGFSIFCVFVEVILHLWGVLVWEYWWWNWPFVLLIVLVGYMPYFIFATWIHDMPSMKKKITIVSGMYTLDLVCIIVFMAILKWI